MRILVTGGAGFIGSHLLDALVARGDVVTVIDNLSSGRRKQVPSQIKFVQTSVTNVAAVNRVMQQGKFQAVVHLAAQKNARYSLEAPLFDAEQNIIGSLVVMEAMRKYRVKRMVFASTGGVMYGRAKQIPTPETALPQPEPPYAIAKRSIEYYLQFYRQVYGISTIALRLGNVYGPRQDPAGEAGVVAIFSSLLLAHKPATIYGKGTQTRDYVAVSDVVDAFLAAIDKPITGIYNIGTGKQTSVLALYHLLANISGFTASPRHGAAVPADLPASALNAKLAGRRLNWKPRVQLVDGLRLTYEWFAQDSDQ